MFHNGILNVSRYVDPTLEHDLWAQKPWALSPFISSMPNFMHKHLSVTPNHPEQHIVSARVEHFPPPTSIKDDTSQLHFASAKATSRSSPEPDLHENPLHFPTARERQAYFADAQHRKDIRFGPTVANSPFRSIIETNHER